MLGGFSSFFEIFAVLNLAYAGSEYFRENIHAQILHVQEKLISYLDKKKEEVAASVYVALQDNVGGVEKRIDDISRLFKERITKINQYKQLWNEYKNSFKPMFLASSIFCFLTLILAGFENLYCINGEECFMAIYSLIVMLPISIYFIFQFVRSFFPRYCYRKTKSWKIILVFIVLIYVGYLVKFNLSNNANDIVNYLDFRYYLSFSLLIAILPYLLYFILVTFVKSYVINTMQINDEISS